MTRTTRPVILEESQPVKNRNLTWTIWPSQPTDKLLFIITDNGRTRGGGSRCRIVYVIHTF